jgi:hypothetical protein
MRNPGDPTSLVRSGRSPARILLGATLISLALPLSACGGHGGAESRPSVEEITRSLTSGSLAQAMGLDNTDAPHSTLTCVAQKLEDSRLSDAALRALMKADKDFQPSDSDQKALTDLPSQIVSCAAQ